MYSSPVRGYQISPYMQEKMIYVAQMNCYEESSEVLEQFLGVEVTAMQIHRVANTYGSLIEEEAFTASVQPPEREPVLLKEEEVVYAEADGSMVLTREEGWKEVKVGRIFKSGDCHSTGGLEGRGWIKQSQYEAYLGGHREFTRRFEGQLDGYSVLGERLVFISDGAEWIKNWIKETYPKATQILDWYHCKEHLCQFAEIYFEDQLQRNKWVEDQALLLLESRTEQVIKNIQSLNGGNNEKRKAKAQLSDYYQGNSHRMDYKKYTNVGAGIIGSGAIEAAHRSVVQRRMKLSGQRWSKKGAQNMLQLRVTNLSGHWNHIVDLIKEPVQQAA